MIKLENVTKNYSSEVTALQSATFDVAKGEFGLVFFLDLGRHHRLEPVECLLAVLQLAALFLAGGDEPGGLVDEPDGR